MTKDTAAALQVALAYHEAVARKDLDGAMEYIAEGLVCDAPPGRLEGAEAFRAFMTPFVEMLIGTKMIAAFGDERQAVLMYDTETALVKSGPGAEYVTVEDGKITYNRFVFDRLPFEAARKATANR